MSEHQGNSQQPAQVDGSSGEDSFISGLKGSIGVIVGLFVVFVLLPCGACTMCGGGMTCLGAMGDYEERMEAEQQGQEAESESGEELRTAEFGERFTLGDFAYTIDDVGVTNELGPDISPTQAGSGAVFVLVEYRIENLKNETATTLSADFELRDEEDRQFSSSSKVETALAMMDSTDFIVSELQPGLEKEATVGFEVSEAATDGRLTLVVPEKGFSGTEEVYVPFQFSD